MDVDFLLRRVSKTPKQLRKVLEEIIDISTGNEYVTFEIMNIHRSLSLEFSGYMKDYYDIYYLVNKFDFDGAILTDALKTFENRGHVFTIEQFEQVMTFDDNEGVQKMESILS